MKSSKENIHVSTIKELAILPSKNAVLFPHMVVPWIVEQPNLVKMLDEALAGDRTIAVFNSINLPDGVPQPSQIGTMGIILRMAKGEEGQARVIVQSMGRVRILEILATEPYVRARCEITEEIIENTAEVQALTINVKQAFARFLELSPNIPNELAGLIANIDAPGAIADIIVGYLNIPAAEKQAVLETLDVPERLHKTLLILNHQLELLELSLKIQNDVKAKLDKTQKDFFLREQMNAIKKELGEGENGGPVDEIAELKEKLAAKGLPESAMKEAERELERLSRMHPSSAEYTVSRTYLDWTLNLPWNEASEDQLDIKKAAEILDADHYNMEKVKKRILEYLAVRKLNPGIKGTILCFVGPPGTGKTSLGRSIASATGRKFHRIALGGMRDEAEIRGHRRTYIGSMPGAIIQGLRKVGVKNPVFLLDELDKIGADFRGDPAAALLEVLDPEQNVHFTDHYMGVEFDLSQIIFIATANTVDTISSPLLDRMEVIELSGYTYEEKYEIAKRYLVPRQMETHGLKAKHISFDKKAVAKLISEYTREAGVRNLERQIAAVCRGVARKVAEGDDQKHTIRPAGLVEYLGKPRFTSEVAERTSIPGVATGLAWTPVGGEILFIEATRMKGGGKLTLTGKLGDIMKESAQTALSYVRSKAESLGISKAVFQEEDIHIHVPAGAIPKDGPSAGVAMTMALVSLLKDKPIRPDVAMTGEISLRGLVLPVGGIKEKVLAAHRAGIKEVILPKRNAPDLDELPSKAREELHFHLVHKLDEAMNLVFN
ncbi:MAG: endopeptidase La [Dissulfuribacterales bacterium]